MIIAFTGAKGSGKDYAGSIVAERYGLAVKSFADPIRIRIRTIFQLESDGEYDVFKRSEHRVMGNIVHGREIVRGLGMAMRDVNENFPLEYMDQFVNSNITITDLRFDNEMEWCKRNDVIVIKIVSSDDQEDDHISERGFDDDICDGVVYNRKTSTFGEDLCFIVERIKQRKGIQ